MTNADTTADRAAAAATYIASGGAVLFGLTANELAAYVGICVAILTFGVNIWFKWQHLKAVREAVNRSPANVICEVPKDD